MKNQNLEEFFKNSSSLQKSIFFIISLFFIIIFIFQIVIEPLNKQEEDLKQEIISLKQSIKNENPKALKKQEEFLKKELLKEKTKLAKLRENLNIIESKIYSLPYFYKEEKFAKELERILKRSIEKNIQIISIKRLKNDTNETNDALKEIKKIKIQGKGDFKNIVYFINDIEEADILSDIRDVKLKKGKREVIFSLVWTLYGIKL